jgi:hypothetical protein
MRITAADSEEDYPILLDFEFVGGLFGNFL